MRILQVSNKSPWPPSEGGPIAMHALIKGLQDAGHQVHVLTMSTAKFPVNTQAVPEKFASQTAFRAVDLDTSVRAGAAFRNLFTRQSYNIERFISPVFKEVLKEKLRSESYDAVILESLFVTPYIPAIRECTRAKIIFRAHNIEHRIWERLAGAARNPLKRFYLRLLARRLLQYEHWVIPTVDGIAAITARDADFFREHAGSTRVDVVPFGINPDDYIFTPQDKRRFSLCHIGSMDWLPNQEGIRWFLEKCWGGMHQVYPELKLCLAGRNMPSWLEGSSFPNVAIVGEVEDAQSFITNHPVMVVPLLSGSGVRVKIIEAMALGRTVITTTIGAEGIHYKHDSNIYIADSPVAFFEVIKTLIKNPEKCAETGFNARQMIETDHNYRIATEAMLGLIARV